MASVTHAAGSVLAKEEPARHAFFVRTAHLMNAICFFLFLASAALILVAQPWLSWGESGYLGGPHFVRLPIPQNETLSGWGRSLHFLAAWICLINGTVYIVLGFIRRHFVQKLWPAAGSLQWRSLKDAALAHLHPKRVAQERGAYNVLQRLAYLSVVFVQFPVMALTGFAMSKTITASMPWLVTMWGGHQSARTIHFFVMCSLLLFLGVHVFMVSMAGFRKSTKAMVLGD